MLQLVLFNTTCTGTHVSSLCTDCSVHTLPSSITRYVTPRKVQFGFYFAHTMTSGLQSNAVNTLESKSPNKKIGSKTYVDVGKLFLEKGSCTIEMKPANWTHEMEHTYHPIHPSTPTLPVEPSFGMALNVKVVLRKVKK